MNTCEKLLITIIFYLYSDTGPHIVRGPLRPLILVTFEKENTHARTHALSIVFQYSEFSGNFPDFFDIFFKTRRYAAT